MSEEPESFIDYWDAVDAALLRFFGIDTAEAGIDAAPIAEAQESGWTAEEFARWWGDKYDLDYIVSYDTLYKEAGKETP